MRNLITIFLIFSSFNISALEDCMKADDFKDVCTSHISNIHPSQFAIGSYSIKYKSGKIEKEWAENELTKYIKEEVNPAVFGPDHKIWIIDGHHFHYSLFKANIPEDLKRSYIEIIADFRNKSEKKFQAYMIKNQYVFLKDQKFNDIKFKELPNTVGSLRNNPYRSLAWIVRKHEGFDKSDTPFAEFMWGEFYKNNGIKLEKRFEADRDADKLKEAISLSSTEEASYLPGFKH